MPSLAQAANVEVQVSSFTDSPDPAIRGGQITYTTVLKNGGPAVATNVTVTWPIPATTTFVSVSDGAGGGTCVHDNTTPPGVVTCSYGSVPIDDSTSSSWKTIALVVQTTASTPASINTSATATQADNTDTNPGNNSLSQITTINNGADLSFAISGAANPSVGAGNVTWSINGSNLGPDTSGPITVTVPIPGTLTYVSGSGTGWSCGFSAPNAVCTRAALTSGTAYSALSIVTKITSQIAGGTLTVGGSIAETGVGDPVTSNNSATASVTVNPGLDLQITQDPPSPSSANAGGVAMTFVLLPTNLGPYDATTGANVSFPLPAGFSLTSANGTNGWTCTSAGSPITVTCSTNSNFASAATSVLTIVAGTPVTVPVSTQYSLTGTVAVNAGGPTDPIAGNNTASRDVTVGPVGLDLSLTKNKTPAIVAAGANMTSTIVVKSATGGVQAASGTITVVDVLDTTKETYASFAGTNWACVESPVGTVTCNYNATLNGGADTLPLTITTVAVAAGTATNNATVGYSGTPGDYNSANDTIGASATVTAVPNSPDLIAGITVTTPGGAAATLEVGESTVTYTATLTNNLATNVGAVNTKMTLTIPALVSGDTDLGTIIVNVPNTSTATYSCPAATTALSTSTIVCTQTAGTLTAGDVVTFTVPISRALKDGTFTNGVNVAVTSTTQGDPTPGNNAASATVVIDPIADIELVSKNITSANPAKAGTNVTYVVTLKNNGPSSAAGLAMSDVFTIPGGDAGFTFISANPSNSGTCSGLTAGTSYPSGTPTLSCAWASPIASAGTYTVTVVVRPNWMPGVGLRTLSNTASVTTTTWENTAHTDNGNNSKTAVLNIDPAQVDALINNTDNVDPLGYDPAAASIGAANITNDIVYDVAVTNNGPSLATGVGFTYTMTPPLGKTIVFRGDGAASTVASSTISGTIGGSICNNVGTAVTGPAPLVLTCTFGAPGQLIDQATTHRYLVFRVSTSPATGGDTYNTNSTVITNETDSLASNNNEAETTTVRRRVDLTVAKVPSLATVQIRQPYNWTITLTNVGPGESDVTTLTDTLPAGMEFSGAAPSFTTNGAPAKAGNCGIVGQVMTCNISTSSAAPFAFNEVATVTVPVRMTAYPTVPSAGTARNCASATTDQVDPTSSNNTAICSDVTVQRSSIAGRVFNDPNRDGIYIAAGTEIGLNGWSITLTGTDLYGNTVNLTQPTAGVGVNVGNFLFNDLSPADATGYVLTQTQLTTHVNGPTDPTAPSLSGSPALLDEGVYSRGALASNTTYTAIKLAGNQAGTNFNFPEVKRPSLSGVVYVDINSNNVYNSGTDTNIAGATVVLRNAADLGNSVATTVTAANGTYSFANLDPLINYVVEEPLPTTPAGLVNKPSAVNIGTVNAVATGAALPNTAGNNVATPNTDQITGIVLSSGIDGINYNFGENQTTTISGLVYIDRDRNGSLTGADIGRIPGVSIELRQGGTSCATATLVGTTTTAVNGSYTFPGGDVVAAQVFAGANYRVCEVQPTNYNDGGTNVGTNGTTPGTNDILITNLPSSGSVNNNFGEQGTNLSGYVYQDYGSGTPANDDNGILNVSESGITNVPVTLVNTGTNAIVVANSVGSGRYDFYDLPAGTYTVTEGAIPLASGTYSNGRTTVGTVAATAVGVAGNDTITAIVLGNGVDAINYNFGELLTAGTVTGMVYIDGACNAVKDAADTQGVAGVTVRLVQGANCATGTTIQTAAITTATGVYTFSGVGANANYLICKTPPAGYGNGAPASNFIAINNLPVIGSGGNNFGQCVGSIAGSVYRDFGTATSAATNNGARDVGELGIANVPVTLTGTDAAGTTINTTVITDATGNYVFPGLLEANATGYTVREGAIPPASGSYSDGKDNAGNAIVAAGNATIVNDQISGIRISAGQNAIGYIFGELPPPIAPSMFPDLVVTKTTPTTRLAEGGSLTYTLSVKNVGDSATVGNYTVTDSLPATTGTPAKWTLETAAGTGWSCAITADKLSVSCTNNVVLQPGEVNPTAIALTVKVGTGAAAFSPLRNVVLVSGGGEPEGKKPQPPEVNAPKTCGATPEFNVCQLETPVDNSTPDMVVTKAASKEVFTEGNLGSYVLRVKNAGAVPTSGIYTVTDSLPANSGTPAKWAIESASGNGWTCGVSADQLSVTCDASAVLQPGMESPSTIAVSVRLATDAVNFGPLRNVVKVSGGGESDDKKPQPGELTNPPLCSAAPEANVCYVDTPLQRSAGLSGHVWIDGGIKKVLGAGDKPLPQWIVEVYDITDPAAQGKTFTELVRSGVAKQTFITDSKGYYEACNLQPNSTYRVLFRDPANRIAFPGVVTNEQGRVTGSDYYSQVKEQEGFQVLEVNLPSGKGGPGCGGNGISAPEQSLPLDPNGVVYDSITRAPVSGAKVTLKPEGICTGYDPKLHIINYETYGKDAQGDPTMVTGEDGFYKFLLTGDPTAPKSCQYKIELEPPSGYKTPPSGLIPPNGPLNTPAGPGIFEVQPQKSAPAGEQSTTYHYLLLFGLNHQEVFHNHLPLDPMIAGKLVLTKQGDKRLAEVGDTVLYTITVRLLQGYPVAQATVRDRLPAGLTLVPGTVRVNDKPAPDPLGGLGPVLAFNLGAVNANAQATLTYRVRVGVGAMQGDGINRARAHGCQVASGCVDVATLLPLVGSIKSNEGQHKVEITGGVFTSDACVLGKVFVDCNNNHVQDAEELGIPGVRLFFEDGRYAVSDSEGKYSRCSITPQSHVLKVDPSTLPLGSRLTTTSNRNLGDAGSLFIDLKNGELHRADFAEGSCTNAVLEQVKARRTQGEIRSVEVEKPGGPPLRFQSKPKAVPQQGTDSANQPLIQSRQGGSSAR